MKNNDEQNQRIVDDMKLSMQEIGFSVSSENTNQNGVTIETRITYGDIGISVSISYYPRMKMMDIVAYYGRVPNKRIGPLYELLNYLNVELIASHFAVQPGSFAIALRSGIHVAEDLDKNAFKETLQQIVAVTYKCYPVLSEYISSKAMPRDIIRSFAEKWEAAGKFLK